MIECGIVTGAAGFLGHIHSESILDLYAGLVIVDINKKKTRNIIQKLKNKLPQKENPKI